MTDLDQDVSIRLQPTQPDRPFLLASDIDGTLLGDEAGEAQLKKFIENHRESLALAFVTGRTLESVMRLIEEGRLPTPDFIASSVGTELFAYRDPENALGHRYAAQVTPAWDLETVYAIGEGEGIHRQTFIGGHPRFQAGFAWDGEAESLAAFHRRFEDRKEYCILPSFGQFIDVLPVQLGKGAVVQFLQEALELSPERVVVAGDSGNDREMFATPYKGIFPANGLDELKTFVDQPWHYHSPLPAARGVIDGLHHFGFVSIETTD